MAEFSKRIKSRYNVETYQGTKETYEWICKALKSFTKENSIAVFEFQIGDIECTCKSIEELVEIAYGRNDYKLIGFYIKYYLNGDNDISVVCVKNRLSVTTQNKTTLEKTVELLVNFEDIKTDSIKENISVYNNCNVNCIKGNNNSVVQGDNNKVTFNKELKKKSKIKELIVNIFERILKTLK